MPGDRDRPRDFIAGWCDGPATVSEALVSSLARTPRDPQYMRFFRFQQPSASVTPLLVGAAARGIRTWPIPDRAVPR